MQKMQASGLIGRTLGLAVLSLSLAVTAGVARAADNDGRTMSEKISDGFYGMIRGTNMDNRGIDYRERSPLVVPPTLDLPPPVNSAGDAQQIANWPKDPDERARKAVIAAKKKNAPPVARVQAAANGTQAPQAINIAPPVDEPAPSPGTTRRADAPVMSREATDPVYDKGGDLFTGGASELADKIGFGGDWFGSKKSATYEPGTEPAREALTQPPVGYQTPAAGYAYGEQKKSIWDGQANPDRNPLAQKSSASSVVH
ncbi:MAG TPA: hypothetical protein VFL62_14235 [Bradyrhizobium sp.]|uniref:hypothetical protein n=1 Tax=Bradyrhizobium sp. TaxID=376 RepID=UPI002D807F20|nr:hypothetical protein [Bradyrhizobium sp.]HET7887384.1 hypothetical protein [Bradyrhizobium sp.]